MHVNYISPSIVTKIHKVVLEHLIPVYITISNELALLELNSKESRKSRRRKVAGLRAIFSKNKVKSVAEMHKEGSEISAFSFSD